MPNLDLAKFPALQADGYLRSQRHPALPLTIWSYTEKTQGEGYWTPETRAARGLIVADDGEIVARGLPKFHNFFEEHADIPWGEAFEVFEKVDGRLAIVTYREPYGLVVSSRGSFTSDEAERARQLLLSTVVDDPELGEIYGPDADWVEPNVTYCFELVDPAFRIVLDYGKRSELVLLAAYWTDSGEEIPLADLEWMPFTQPRRFPPASLEELAATEDEDSEGYVVRYASGYRVKVKLSRYLELFKIVTGTSERTIWEMLSTGASTDALFERVPDEFHAWATGVANRLRADYDAVRLDALRVVGMVASMRTRREQAEYIWANAKNPAAAFKLLDRRDPSKAIWKSLKPASSRPYWNLEAE